MADFGKLKQRRGRVRHVLMDTNNSEHVKAANELGANVLRGEGFGVMLQFFEGKPSGYIEFECGKKSKDAHISHIFIKDELRDTVSGKKISWEERNSKFEKITGKYINTEKRPNKREETKIRSLNLQAKGIKKRDKQLMLGAKLVKSLNTKLGFHPTTTHGTSSQGERHIQKYMLYGYSNKSKPIRQRR